MLTGQSVTLRQVREADLDLLYDAHTDIRNRGRGSSITSAIRRREPDLGG